MTGNGNSTLPPPDRFAVLEAAVEHHERTLYGEADEYGVVRDGLAKSVERIEGMLKEVRTMLQDLVDERR